MEDASLRGDTIVMPPHYLEAMDLFRIGRRNRAAVFRISVEAPGGEETNAAINKRVCCLGPMPARARYKQQSFVHAVPRML